MSCGTVKIGIERPFNPPITEAELERLHRLSNIILEDKWSEDAEVFVNRLLEATASYWRKLEGRFSVEYCAPDPIRLTIATTFEARWMLADGTWSEREGALLPLRRLATGQKGQNRMWTNMGDQR